MPNEDSTIASRPDVQALPFIITPVSSTQQMSEVLRLRHRAYSRHDYTDQLKQSMLRPDEQDFGTSVTLVAASKSDGQVLGTVRLTSNLDGPVSLPENLPWDPCLEGTFTYIDRFALSAGAGQALVASALIKAVCLWVLGRDTRWGIAAARAPLARRYRRLGGLMPLAGGTPFLMEEYHCEPYFLVGSHVSEGLARVRLENPEFSQGFVSVVHPDIQVQGKGLSWEECPAVLQQPVDSGG